jgi:hypothetical protein
MTDQFNRSVVDGKKCDSNALVVRPYEKSPEFKDPNTRQCYVISACTLSCPSRFSTYDTMKHCCRVSVDCICVITCSNIGLLTDYSG